MRFFECKVKKAALFKVIELNVGVEEGGLEDGHGHAEDCFFGHSGHGVKVVKVVDLLGSVEMFGVDRVAVVIVGHVRV